MQLSKQLKLTETQVKRFVKVLILAESLMKIYLLDQNLVSKQVGFSKILKFKLINVNYDMYFIN